MSRHEARAVRGQYGDTSLWRARCACGWRAEARSKQDAERLAKVHSWAVPAERRLLQAEAVARQMSCHCYHPDELEYDPHRKCPKCQLLELLGDVAA